MTEHGLSADEIKADLWGDPDMIRDWITRIGMSAHEGGRLWKLIASEINQWLKGGFATERPTPISKPTGPITPEADAKLAELKKLIAAMSTKPTTNKLGEA